MFKKIYIYLVPCESIHTLTNDFFPTSIYTPYTTMTKQKNWFVLTLQMYSN